MSESAMVREAEGAAMESAKNVEIRGFSREREGQRGQRRLAIQSRASQTCAGQEVGEGFQTEAIILSCSGKLGQPVLHSISAPWPKQR